MGCTLSISSRNALPVTMLIKSLLLCLSGLCASVIHQESTGSNVNGVFGNLCGVKLWGQQGAALMLRFGTVLG